MVNKIEKRGKTVNLEHDLKNKAESAVIIVPNASGIAGIMRFFEDFDESSKGS
jgi:hypothetical protein